MPVPLLAMYALGLVVSWLVMGVIVNRMMGDRHVLGHEPGQRGPGHGPGHGHSDGGMDGV